MSHLPGRQRPKLWTRIHVLLAGLRACGRDLDEPLGVAPFQISYTEHWVNTWDMEVADEALVRQLAQRSLAGDLPTVRHDPPLTEQPAPTEVRGSFDGTCTGTLTDRHGLTHQLELRAARACGRPAIGSRAGRC